MNSTLNPPTAGAFVVGQNTCRKCGTVRGLNDAGHAKRCSKCHTNSGRKMVDDSEPRETGLVADGYSKDEDGRKHDGWEPLEVGKTYAEPPATDPYTDERFRFAVRCAVLKARNANLGCAAIAMHPTLKYIAVAASDVSAAKWFGSVAKQGKGYVVYLANTRGEQYMVPGDWYAPRIPNSTGSQHSQPGGTH